MANLPAIKLDRGIHALHLFYRVDRRNAFPNWKPCAPPMPSRPIRV